LECLGRQVGLSSVVLTPFIGAHNLFSIGYCGRPVEALSERVSDQGSTRGMLTVDPTVDITQKTLPLFDGDAMLQDPSVASLVEFNLNKDKRLKAMSEPSSLRLVHRQRLAKKVVEVRHPLVGQRVGLCCRILIKLHDFRWDGATDWLAPEPRADGSSPACSDPS